MKHTKALIPLLCVLALTGCSARTDTSAPTEPMTEPATETEAVTETVLVTEAPVDDPEEAAYAYIRSTLLPQYGLSATDTLLAIFVDDYDTERRYQWFDHSDPIPAEAQGLIAAAVRDLSGDSVPELVTLRAEDWSLILDAYRIGNDTCTPLGSFTVCTYSPHEDFFPYVWMQDDLLLVESYVGTFSIIEQDGYKTNRSDEQLTTFTALHVTDNGFEAAVTLTGGYTADKVICTVGDEDLSAAPGEADIDRANALAAEALDALGIRYKKDPPQPFYNYYEAPDDAFCDAEGLAFRSTLSVGPPDGVQYLMTIITWDSRREIEFHDNTQLHKRLSEKAAPSPSN
ncbi:MAG: hypothetical protein K5695_06040 [Oscillospiraceae bacterium]|nr:hypothetical protein [Oscillospiraceae bacterium]